MQSKSLHYVPRLASQMPMPMPTPPRQPDSTDHMPSWAGDRQRQRRRSHQEAHADAQGQPGPEIPDHPLIPGGEPEMVETADVLEEAVAALRGAGRFAYDTEFIGETSYFPRICVIQAATVDRVFLIDPLTIGDGLGGDAIAGFWDLLIDPSVQKLVHAGRQDLEPPVRVLNEAAANVFDTQIAAAFAGLRYPMSLDGMLADVAGIDSGHGLKFSQWDSRPLSPVQLAYAAKDVRYLHVLQELIEGRCRERGTLGWAIEESESLCDPTLHTFEVDLSRIKASGSHKMNGTRRAVLRALVLWREEEARERDVPPRALIQDSLLGDLAWQMPEDLGGVANIKGFPRPAQKEYGHTLIDLIAHARVTPEQPLPSRGKIDHDARRDRINDLWDTIAARAAERDIDPAIVTSKKDLTRCLAQRDTRDLDAAEDDAGPEACQRIKRGWRGELLAGLELTA